MRVRTSASFLWLSALVAQAPQPALQLPTLLRLGSLPADVPTVAIDGGGGATLASLPAGTKAIALRADHRTPMSAVQAVLDDALAKGLEKVFLVASLRDGTPGALTLALPTAMDAPITVSLRAHRERPGVPPESAIPLLRRLHDGWEQGGKGPFVLGITLPDDATYAHLLSMLAAAAEARLPSVVVRTSKANAAERASGSLAIDLESSFVAQVQAREQVQPKAGVQDTPFGMLHRAPDTAVVVQGGAAGGLYGGRGGQAAKAADDARLQALELALTWLLRQQLPDGSFPDQHAQGDVEGTALVSLVLLGRGKTLEGGPDCDPLRRSIGWLLARQHDDGRFADFGPNATRHHALAAFALTEAAGLSAKGPLFQPCAQLALDWLFTQQRDDGGWNDGTPNAASDPLSTAAAMMSVGSATFFHLRTPATTKELIGWFDAHRSTTPTPAGAELFCRFFAGQSPKTAPLGALADMVVTADPRDPTACQWASYALFQMGGQHWQQWTDRCVADVVARQETKGNDAGSWSADGPSRLAATARFTWSLAAWYRYSRIVKR